MEYDTWLVSHFHYLNAIKKPQNVQLLDLFCILLLSQNKSYTTVYWNKCKLHHATSSSQPLDFHFQSGSPKHEFTHCSLWNFRCSHYASAGKGIMPLTSIRKTGQISFKRKHNNRRLVAKTILSKRYGWTKTTVSCSWKLKNWTHLYSRLFCNSIIVSVYK